METRRYRTFYSSMEINHHGLTRLCGLWRKCLPVTFSVIEQQDRVMAWCTLDGHWVHTIIIVFVWRQIMIFILGLVLFNYVLNMLRWVPLFPTVVDKGGNGTARSAVFGGSFQSVLETVMYIIHALLRHSDAQSWGWVVIAYIRTTLQGLRIDIFYILHTTYT